MEAFTYLHNKKIDLIFLDINMPEVSGISLAKSISKDIKVIFTTAYRDYAVEGFELKAVDYLLKPISFDRLQAAISSYVEIYQHRPTEIEAFEIQTDFMFVRADRQMVKIDFNEIYYIESVGDYLKIHLVSETIVTRETLTALEAKLPIPQFLRIHRSFIISVLKIEAFTNEHVSILKSALPISRSYKKNVLSYLEKF